MTRFYCACYFDDMFYIHFVGSMEYWTNEGMNLYQNFFGRDLSYGSDFRNTCISILIHCDFKQLFYYFYCTTDCFRTGEVTHVRYYA